MTARIPLETAHWTGREFGRVLRWKLGAGAPPGDAERLSTLVRERLGGAPFHFVNSGRTALAIALTILQRRAPQRRQVLIPDYVCPAVPDTIRRLGLTPVAVPVGRDLNLLAEPASAALAPNVLAVIGVHMYAHRANIEGLTDACKTAGVALIDDAAHLLGAPDAALPIPGTGGSFGLVSFAQSKSMACGYSGAGGLLIVNETRFEDEARAAIDDLPPVAADTRALAFALSGRAIAPGMDPLWRLTSLLERGMDSDGEPSSLQAARMPALHLSLALVQLESLDTRIADKRRVAGAYWQAMSPAVRQAFVQYAPGRYLTRVMLRARTIAARNELRERLAEAGVATRAGYPAVGANSLSGEPITEVPLVEVPSNYDLASPQIERVVAVLDKHAATHLIP